MCFFRDACFRPKSATCGPTCPKVTPKGSRNRAKSHPSWGCCTSPNICYLLHGSHIGPLGAGSGGPLFSNCFPDTNFLHIFCDIRGFRWPNGAKRAPYGTRRGYSNLLPGRPDLQDVPRGDPGEPRVVQTVPTGCRNGAPGNQK